MTEKNRCDPTAKIWLTSRIRMEASARYYSYDTISHVMLTFYSILLLAGAVFSDSLKESAVGMFLDEILIVLAICILAANLMFWGLNYGRTARQHEECYLELERILSSKQSNEEKITEYHAVKKQFPNHKTRDYEKVLFRKIFLEKKNLTDSRGEKILFGCKRAVIYLLYSGFRKLVILFFFLLPVIIVLATISVNWF